MESSDLDLLRLTTSTTEPIFKRGRLSVSSYTQEQLESADRTLFGTHMKRDGKGRPRRQICYADSSTIGAAQSRSVMEHTSMLDPAAYEGPPFPLTAGQASAWMNFDGAPAEHLALPVHWTIAATLPVDHVDAAVTFLHARHEMLRATVVRYAKDGVRQQVRKPRPVPIRTLAAPLDVEDVAALDAVMNELKTEPFDLANQLPVRWYLGRALNANKVLIAIFHHFFAGFQGCEIVRAELPVVLANLIAGRAPDTGLSPARSPRALVADEDGPVGRRRAARAAAHVRELLTTVPSTAFPPPVRSPSETEPTTDRRIGVEFTSRAVYQGAEQLSRQWKVPVSVVMLAAFTLAIRPILRDESALIWQLFGDRASDGPRGATVVYDPATTLLSGAGLPVDLHAAALELYRRVLAALRSRGYGESAVLEETHRISVVRGIRVEVPFWFNFVSAGTVDPVADPESLIAEDEFADFPGDETQGDDFLLYGWHFQGETRMGLYAHERYVGRSALKGVLTHATDLLYAAAFSRAPGNRPDAVLPESSRWSRLHGDRWADPVVVRDVLRSLPGVRDADVIVDAAARLCATVSVSAAYPAERLRTVAYAQLDVPGFAVPDEFEILIDTDERAAAEDVARDEAGHLFAELVQRLCALPAIDAGKSFLSAGGTVRAIPSVLVAARAAGWPGLTWRDLVSHQSLHVLATKSWDGSARSAPS